MLPGWIFIDSKGEKQLCGNGNFADVSVFSFHPVKHIATGEGGMATTNCKELYENLCLYRTPRHYQEPGHFYTKNHGGWYYEMQELGYNYRITDFQAALGISQLKRADMGLARRHEIARRYREGLSDLKGVKLPFVSDQVFHAYHLFIIQVEDRLGLYDYLIKVYLCASSIMFLCI